MYGETLCHKLYPITCAPDAKLADVMGAFHAVTTAR